MSGVEAGVPVGQTVGATDVAPYGPASYDVEQIRQLMKQDLDYFAGVVAPETFVAEFADIHHSIWALLTEAVHSGLRLTKHAVGIPRGHAKTHLLKLLCVYIVLFTDIEYILVVCNSHTLACDFIDDVLDMLTEPNVIQLFGDWRQDIIASNTKRKEFLFGGRAVILKPIGATSSVRGTVINNKRPQVMIGDDMQSREDAESPEVSKKLQRWFLGTLLKARDYSRACIIYLGNMYPDVEIGQKGSGIYTCILRNLQKDPSWVSWITGAILADGSVIWPYMHPLESLLEDLAADTRMGQANVWYAEVQNDPEADKGQWFDIELLPAYKYHEKELPIGKFLMIDPSLGKKTSDSQEVGLCYVYDETCVVLHDVRTFQCSAPELVKGLIEWALEENLVLICAEAYGYQETLLQWFYYVLQGYPELENAFELVGVQRGDTKSKNIHIQESFKVAYNGALLFGPEAAGRYIAQAQNFSPLKKDNVDDVLDIGVYAVHVWNKYRHLYVKSLRSLRGTVAGRKPEKPAFVPAKYDFRTAR